MLKENVMKKNIMAAAITAVSIMAASSAFAADGQVNFVGKIIDTGCDVVNTPTNPLLVTLGDVYNTAFQSPGDTAAATDFTLKLTGCPATVTSAQVKFDGVADNGNNRILKLTQDAGVAQGVGIQLSDTNSVLPLYTASTAYPLVVGDNDLNFVARYVATSIPVGMGPANAVATFTLIYN